MAHEVGGREDPGQTPSEGGRSVPAVDACPGAQARARRRCGDTREPVPQAARLAAAPAVAAAPADHAGQQAVAGVPVAERPVDERFELEAVGLERADLGEAQLAGEDRPGEAEAIESGELSRRVGVELRAGVQRQTGVALAHESGEAQVGDDERVHAGEVRRFQRLQRRLDLVVLEQRVEREVGAGVEAVREVHGARGLVAGEVAGEGARAPALEAEVDRVGAGGEGGAQGALVAGRRQELDARPGRHGFMVQRGRGAAPSAPRPVRVSVPPNHTRPDRRPAPPRGLARPSGRQRPRLLLEDLSASRRGARGSDRRSAIVVTPSRSSSSRRRLMPSESLDMCPAMTTCMLCFSASSRSSWLMCMPTMVPTPASASFSMTCIGPSVPPVMSTQILPARRSGCSSPTYGPAPC